MHVIGYGGNEQGSMDGLEHTPLHCWKIVKSEPELSVVDGGSHQKCPMYMREVVYIHSGTSPNSIYQCLQCFIVDLVGLASASGSTVLKPLP